MDNNNKAVVFFQELFDFGKDHCRIAKTDAWLRLEPQLMRALDPEHPVKCGNLGGYLREGGVALVRLGFEDRSKIRRA